MLTARVVLLLLGAFILGVAGAAVVAPRRAPPPPTPVVVPATPQPTPTPAPTDDPRVFSQPLVAGCSVAADDVYVVSLHGGIAHFDGARWSLVDDTLRDLRAISCARDVVAAVGDGGRLVRIDPVARTIRVDIIAPVDLFAVAAIDARTIYAAGADQVVVRFAGGQWPRIEGAAGKSWRALHAASAAEIWVAGDAGALFLFDGTRFLDRSLPRGPDLTALGGRGGLFVGGADGRLLAVARSGEVTPSGRADGPVRSIFTPDESSAYVVSTTLRLFSRGSADGALVDTTLACSPRAAWGTGPSDLWVLGSDGARVGLARFDGVGWTKLGSC